MSMLLDAIQSSYYPAFKNLYKDIKGALMEAQDINDYLKPLIHYFDIIESTEFTLVRQYFSPLFHTICLVWAHSKFYCRQTRIIILLQEINNLIIKRGTEFLDPIHLFKLEPEEAVEKVETCLQTFNAYASCYEAHRVKVKKYFKNGLPSRGWEFTPKLAFNRFDRFVEKIKMLKVRLKDVYFSGLTCVYLSIG